MILYEGPSALDGKPIVAIATVGSHNPKTGPMVQTWIMRADLHPIAASKAQEDSSVCGACPLRRSTGGGCYVNIGFAPSNIWKKYTKGGYLQGTLPKAPVRLGSYGDPAAVPVAVWKTLLKKVPFVTGYTHQWRSYPDLKQWCMASVDSEAEALEAQSLGWRTFRVKKSGDHTLLPYEIKCPASAEAGFKTTCDWCKACGGLSSKAKVNIAIQSHGVLGSKV